ncbi:AMIN-like domain-containing (lipo)protein [Myceligenerans salitolerans]|uniref:AMIN-like domain-containing protein n=1 Tax=Myceligenerans salitolerans TaxID=1230528 RepID=A0ABS3I4T1_9MICO|nr:hypothetical protein [Myceligenerans salitolerans]MBO0607621.1 hypothetical protein [Myceligenerans salitolerans]
MTLRRSLSAALVLPAVLALLAAGCTGDGEPAGAPSETGTVGGGSGASPSGSPASDAPGTGAPDDDGASGDGGTGGGEADGDGDGGSDEDTPTSAPPFTADTSPDRAEPTGVGETFLTVTDIRTGVHDGFDRVVFDLEGTGSGTPGWDVRYVPEARDDGSGHRVDVAGDAILQVRISGTAAPTDSGVPDADRTPIRPASTEAVEEVVYRTWFEGYSTAFVGVDEAERPFRVFLLTDPVRVVLDVQH